MPGCRCEKNAGGFELQWGSDPELYAKLLIILFA
jgi:hypothetical protein